MQKEGEDASFSFFRESLQLPWLLGTDAATGLKRHGVRRYLHGVMRSEGEIVSRSAMASEAEIVARPREKEERAHLAGGGGRVLSHVRMQEYWTVRRAHLAVG